MSSNYAFSKTDDGSWTLAHPGGERMHHSGGAYGETEYIYGTAVREVLSRGWDPSFLSVGLGLGYVETVCASLAGGAPGFRLLSFEADGCLRELFPLWLADPASASVPPEFATAYPEILRRANILPAALLALLQKGAWKIEGALDAESRIPAPSSAILFDAYSGNTSPELWTEGFLDGFLARAAAPRCVLATYAFKGSLRRSLERAGFVLQDRAGYSGKRQSTLAIREN